MPIIAPIGKQMSIKVCIKSLIQMLIDEERECGRAQEASIDKRTKYPPHNALQGMGSRLFSLEQAKPPRENGLELDSLLADGLHPNDEGYRVMFKLIIDELGV